MIRERSVMKLRRVVNELERELEETGNEEALVRVSELRQVMDDVSEEKDIFVNHVVFYPCTVTELPQRNKGDKGETQFRFRIRIGEFDFPIIYYSKVFFPDFLVEGARLLIYGALSVFNSRIVVKAHYIIPSFVPKKEN